MTTATRSLATFDALTTFERAQDWKRFVADLLVFMTRRKEQREAVEGYQVAPAGGLYVIKSGGQPMFAPMTADAVYSWAERLPLVRLSRQIDELRADIFARAKSAARAA